MGEAIRHYESLSERDLARMAENSPKDLKHLKWLVRRERGRESLWWFTKYVVGNPVLYEPLHKPQCEWVEAWPDKLKKLHLRARGHIKSNINTVSYAAQTIAKDPSTRGFICSHDIKDAERFVWGTARIILSKAFRELYPEIHPRVGRNKRYEKWKPAALQIDYESSLTEPTLVATSPESELTGSHYSASWFDDAVTKDSVATLDLIQGTLNYHRHCQALLDPGAFEMMSGTRKAWNDLYGTILREQADLYDIRVEDIFDENHEPIYPTRYVNRKITVDEAKQGLISIPDLQKACGSFVWNAEYRQHPVDPDTQIFNPDHVEQLNELPPGRHRYFRVWDYASGDMTTSYTAIVTGAVTENETVVITDIFWGQYTELEQIEELIRGQEVAEEFRPVAIGAQRMHAERILLEFARREAFKREVFLPWYWLPGEISAKSKEDRIRGLQPFIETRQFKILKLCRHRDLFLDELIHFRPPAFYRRDILDALAYIPPIMFPGKGPRLDEEPPDPYALPPDVAREFERIRNGQAGRRFIGRDRTTPDPTPYAIPMARRRR